MEKIWLKSYPPGVPAEIDPNTYQSLVDLINKSCKTFASSPAFYNLGVIITYAQLDAYTKQFATYLQQVLKLKKGSRIAIMLPNVLQYPVALFGAMRAGLIVVNVNPLYTPDELVHQINNAGAEVILGLANFASVLEQAVPRMPQVKNIIITELGDLFPIGKRLLTNFALKYFYKRVPAWNIPNAIQFRKVLSEGEHLPFTPVEVMRDDIAFLQYTGGTTGVSKGAILTHRNILANIQQAHAWFDAVLGSGREIIITALPLYHIFSLTANCLFFCEIGGLNVLITNPRDITATVKDMSKFKFTAISGVNTLFNALLKNKNFAKMDFSQLRLTLGGGMAVQRVVAEKWQEITKAPLLEAYGLTETSPCVTINPTNSKGYNGTIGLPVSSTDITIFDDNQVEQSINTPGELAVKGPQVMQGYWQNPIETAKVFTPDGWLLTGDIATVDDKGFVRILERKKDMILVSGFNVYPNEIEDVLARIPGVREVAVVGVPDETSGEAVKAFLVMDKPKITTEEVIKYARQHLTGYKVPKYVEFRDELPKTNVGKILRRALKAVINV